VEDAPVLAAVASTPQTDESTLYLKKLKDEVSDIESDIAETHNFADRHRAFTTRLELKKKLGKAQSRYDFANKRDSEYSKIAENSSKIETQIMLDAQEGKQSKITLEEFDRLNKALEKMGRRRITQDNEFREKGLSKLIGAADKYRKMGFFKKTALTLGVFAGAGALTGAGLAAAPLLAGLALRGAGGLGTYLGVKEYGLKKLTEKQNVLQKSLDAEKRVLEILKTDPRSSEDLKNRSALEFAKREKDVAEAALYSEAEKIIAENKIDKKALAAASIVAIVLPEMFAEWIRGSAAAEDGIIKTISNTEIVKGAADYFGYDSTKNLTTKGSYLRQTGLLDGIKNAWHSLPFVGESASATSTILEGATNTAVESAVNTSPAPEKAAPAVKATVTTETAPTKNTTTPVSKNSDPLYTKPAKMTGFDDIKAEVKSETKNLSVKNGDISATTKPNPGDDALKILNNKIELEKAKLAVAQTTVTPSANTHSSIATGLESKIVATPVYAEYSQMKENWNFVQQPATPGVHVFDLHSVSPTDEKILISKVENVAAKMAGPKSPIQTFLLEHPSSMFKKPGSLMESLTKNYPHLAQDPVLKLYIRNIEHEVSYGRYKNIIPQGETLRQFLYAGEALSQNSGVVNRQI
jgi:hypothetical protein